MLQVKLFAACICLYSVSITVYIILHEHSSSTVTCPERRHYENMDRMARDIHGISLTLDKASRGSDLLKAQRMMKESSQQLDGILDFLARSNLTTLREKAEKTVAEPEVCPEYYNYMHKPTHGIKRGFHVEKCNGIPDFHTLLTITFNFVHYGSEDLKRIPTVIKSVNKHYPKLKIIVAVPPGVSIETVDNISDTEVVTTNISIAETDIWKKLIAKVQTKYVYIGRNVVHFTEFDRLERQIRVSSDSSVYAVASSFRTLHGAKWSNGCDQSVLKNYTLVYTSGYETSQRGCLVCHHVHGPFVTKTEHLAQNPLEGGMTGISGFAVWFLKIKRSGKTVVVCPDSMAFVSDRSQQPTRKEDWTDLAHFFQVERLFPTSNQLLEFGCDEADTNCSEVRSSGMALSHCCLKELADGVKLVMEKCKEEGLLCELDDGTLLGAVKFNGILPWELDADISLHPNNYTGFADKLKPYFTGLGYKWKSTPAGSSGSDNHNLYSKNWKIEIWAATEKMGSESLIEQGLSPTLLYLDGRYIAVPASPGLTSRNQYGYEIYQHVQHWAQTGKSQTDKIKYGTKQFTSCPRPEHHACLDQYFPDGNIKFRDPTF